MENCFSDRGSRLETDSALTSFRGSPEIAFSIGVVFFADDRYGFCGLRNRPDQQLPVSDLMRLAV